jgi:hypothetical protein
MPIMAGTKNKPLRSFASRSASVQAAPLVCEQVGSHASSSARLKASWFVCKQVRSLASSFACLQEAPITHKSLYFSPTLTILKEESPMI